MSYSLIITDFESQKQTTSSLVFPTRFLTVVLFIEVTEVNISAFCLSGKKNDVVAKLLMTGNTLVRIFRGFTPSSLSVRFYEYSILLSRFR